jgi:hypothetical protein
MRPMTIRIFLLLPILGYAACIWAQDAPRPPVYGFFKDTKKVSYVQYQIDNYQTEVRVFDRTGLMVYRNHDSRMHMISYNDLRTDEHGTVRHIRFSSHPDAGIQSYRAEIELDEMGRVVSVQEENQETISLTLESFKSWYPGKPNPPYFIVTGDLAKNPPPLKYSPPAPIYRQPFLPQTKPNLPPKTTPKPNPAPIVAPPVQEPENDQPPVQPRGVLQERPGKPDTVIYPNQCQPVPKEYQIIPQHIRRTN